MTTIRPLTGGINLEVRHIGSDGYALINVGPLPKPSVGGYVSEQSARYPVADLLAALDATANADAEAKLIEQYRRADKAEAELSEAAAQRDEFEDRYETSHASRMHAEECYRREHDRAEKAEAERDALAATVERIKARVESSPSRYLKAKLQECLDPKPAFTLPTDVPARIIAVKRSTGCEKELTLFTDGDTTWWADVDDWGPFWTRSQVMDQFANHRLLPAANEDGGDE